MVCFLPKYIEKNDIQLKPIEDFCYGFRFSEIKSLSFYSDRRDLFSSNIVLMTSHNPKELLKYKAEKQMKNSCFLCKEIAKRSQQIYVFSNVINNISKIYLD